MQSGSHYNLLHVAAVITVFFPVRPQVIWEGGVCVLSVACGWNAGTVCKASESHAYQHNTPSVPRDHVG
jgi:hypothetical protein